MTELAVRDASGLDAKIAYAKFLATSGLLPKEYRQNPGNILYAYEYGELLGLPPIAAITGIHVIEGKPSISAGLMSALVRRAGHRLRVMGDATQAQAWLIRKDDPGFTYKSVWTMERAKQAGLLSKSNWQRYPDAMLKARAVSEVVREACQELLLGMQYTPDELGADDDGGELVHDGFPARANGALDASQMSEEEKDAAGLMTRQQRVEHDALRREGQPPAGAVEKLDEVDPDDPWATAKPAAQVPKPASKAAVDRLHVLLGSLDLGPEEDVIALIHWVTSPAYAATVTEVRNIVTFLEDHLKTAGGDADAARTAIWDQFKRANPQAGDESA